MTDEETTMAFRIRDKVLIGATIVAAIGGGLAAAGVLDGVMWSLRADEHAAAPQATNQVGHVPKDAEIGRAHV